MKTPERWRPLPRRALFASILAWKTFEHSLHNLVWCYMISCDVIWHHDMTSWRHKVTSWRHSVTSFDVICYDKVNLHGPTHKKLQNTHFWTWRPWPLTYDPDLRTHSRYHQGRSAYQILNLKSVCLTVQPWESWITDRRTDRHTDRTDFIPSTADAGGKNADLRNHFNSNRALQVSQALKKRAGNNIPTKDPFHVKHAKICQGINSNTPNCLISYN